MAHDRRIRLPIDALLRHAPSSLILCVPLWPFGVVSLLVDCRACHIEVVFYDLPSYRLGGQPAYYDLNEAVQSPKHSN